MEYYLGITRMEVMFYATTRMHFENILLSKVSTHRMSHIVWFLVCEMSTTGKAIEMESRLEVAEAEEGKERRVTAEGHRRFEGGGDGIF